MAVNSFNAQNPPLTTKGDIYGFSTVPTRVPVGTDGQVLTADSTNSNGVKWSAGLPSQTGQSGNYLTTDGTNASWAAVSSGGFTLISSATLSGASTTISSIPSTYKHLMVVIRKAYCNDSDYQLRFRFNSDTNANYSYQQVYAEASTVSQTSTQGDNNFYTPLKNRNSANANLNCFATLWIYNYTLTTPKGIGITGFSANSGGSMITTNGYGNYNNSTAIDSVTAYPSSVNWSGGTMYVYGVS